MLERKSKNNLKNPRNNFLGWIKEYYSEKASYKISEAWLFALNYQGIDEKVKGRRRMDHLTAVAQLLNRWGMSYEYIIGALLHEILENSAITLDIIKNMFGDNIRDMVHFMNDCNTSAYYIKNDQKFLFLSLADQMHEAISNKSYLDKENARQLLEIINQVESIFVNDFNIEIINDLTNLKELLKPS